LDAWVVDEKDGAATTRRLRVEGGPFPEIWVRVPAPHDAQLGEQADWAAILLVFTAMRARRPLAVHGTVSPSLLRNLDEFQAAWSSWSPELYSHVEISADVEREALPAREPERAVAAFSGGVDALYTALRHQRGLVGRRSRPIGAGVMIHGYDIPANDEAMFRPAFERAERLGGDLGFPVIPVATNYRVVEPQWEHVHIAAVTACLHLFQPSYGVGLVGSSEPYVSLVLPWSSNPVTDHLLSSDRFRIVHDGAESDRVKKLEALVSWPAAAGQMLVCWEPTPDGRNCCRCNKCVRTILNFRVLGLPRPPAFDHDVEDAQIRQMRGLNDPMIAELDVIVKRAQARALKASWIEAVRRVVRRYRVRRRLGSQPAVKRVKESLNRSPIGRRVWEVLRG
jgi:hypothetical protein